MEMLHWWLLEPDGVRQLPFNKWRRTVKLYGGGCSEILLADVSSDM